MREERAGDLLPGPNPLFYPLEVLQSFTAFSAEYGKPLQILDSRRRYRSIMAVSKETPFRRSTWSVTSPEVAQLIVPYPNRRLPPVLPAGALSLSVRNDGPAQSPSRTTSMEAPEAPLASWTLSTPGMLGVVEYA